MVDAGFVIVEDQGEVGPSLLRPAKFNKYVLVTMMKICKRRSIISVTARARTEDLIYDNPLFFSPLSCQRMNVLFLLEMSQGSFSELESSIDYRRICRRSSIREFQTLAPLNSKDKFSMLKQNRPSLPH